MKRAGVLAVCLVIVACGSGAGTPDHPAAGAARWQGTWQQMLPAGAEAVVAIDVSTVAGSKLWQSATLPRRWDDALAQARTLAARCGIPARNVRKLVVVAYGSHRIALALGDFDRGQALRCARAMMDRSGGKLVASTVDGHEVFRSTNPRDRAVVAVPAPGVALIADSEHGMRATLHPEIPRMADAAGAPVMKRIAALEGTSNAWAVMRLDGDGQEMDMVRRLVGSALDGMAEVYARVDVDERIALRLGLVFPTRERAEEAALFLVTTRDLVKTEALGRLSSLIPKIEVGAAGAEATLSLSVSETDLGALLSWGGSVRRSRQTAMQDEGDPSGTVPGRRDVLRRLRLRAASHSD